jgi:hypothetical protein
MWPPREPHGIAAFGTTTPALATAKTWLAGLGADNREDRTAGPDRALLSDMREFDQSGQACKLMGVSDRCHAATNGNRSPPVCADPLIVYLALR